MANPLRPEQLSGSLNEILDCCCTFPSRSRSRFRFAIASSFALPIFHDLRNKVQIEIPINMKLVNICASR